MATDDFRLASGWVTANTLNGSTSYLIRNFPSQSDMTTAKFKWRQPSIKLSRVPYPRYARKPLYLDYSYQNDGGIYWIWHFPVWSLDMLAYLNSTLSSGLVTAKTLKDTHTWEEYQGYIKLPVPGEDYEPNLGGTDGTVTNVNILVYGASAV